MFRPSEERLVSRLVMSGGTSVPTEVQAILKATGGGTPVRPNTPVLPLESADATATFIDPSADIIYFGGLNAVLGTSHEPGSKNVAFEPASDTPEFLTSYGTKEAIPINLSHACPVRVIGNW